MRRFVIAIALLVLLSAVNAEASVLGPYSSAVPSTLTDWSGNLTFPKFSPSLGTLTAVQFDLSSSMQTVLTIHNTSPSGSSGNAKTEVMLTVTDPGGWMGGPQVDYYSPAYNFVLGAGQTVTTGTLTKNSSDSWTYNDVGTLGEFTGAGTITLAAGTLTYAQLGYTGGNTDAIQVTQAQATGKVTYYYEVPEPMTLSLLAIGAMALLGRKRR